jgi:hypothetical protein
MDKHPYGEKKLDWYAPPKGATGLVIRQWYIRDEQHGMPDWFRELIGVQKKATLLYIPLYLRFT